MSRENRNLIINALVFLVIGVVFLVGMTQYGKVKELKNYQQYFSEATSFKKETLSASPLTEKITLYKGKEVVGSIYIGQDSAENIPTHPQWSLLKLQVNVDKNDKIMEVIVLENEHTPSFFASVEQYLPQLKGVSLIDYKDVDEVAGASEYSMPIVTAILNKVTLIQTGKEPNPAKPKDPYIIIFGDYKTKEEDASFTPTALVLSKEIVKDDNDNVLGYAYTLENVANNIPYHATAKLTLIVGLDSENKVIGVHTKFSEHTAGFYKLHEDRYDDLKDRLLADINYASEYADEVDGVAGSTASVSSLWIDELIEALKGVLE